MALSEREWIDLVVAKAHDLRAAGALVIKAGDCAAHFAPLSVEAGATPPEVVSPEPVVDALNDPASYADGIVPGFVIEDEG